MSASATPCDHIIKNSNEVSYIVYRVIHNYTEHVCNIISAGFKGAINKMLFDNFQYDTVWFLCDSWVLQFILK